MRVETPQILWHSEGDKGLNAALMSVSMLQSGIVDATAANASYGNVLATAGNSNLIHLWKVTLSPLPPVGSTSSSSSTTSQTSKDTDNETPAIFQKTRPTNINNNNTKIEFLCSLTRHEGPVNAVAFSPDGLHLCTASETGAVLVWSVPVSKRGGGNGRHFWADIGREQDLVVRRVQHRAADGICDLSWSADSKRFIAGSMDHAVWVCENVNHHAFNSSGGGGGGGAELESEWRVVYHNGMAHTHYVQGVTYDPLGVYLASMSSDRSVRVYPRKQTSSMGRGSKKSKKVLQSANTNSTNATTTEAVQDVLRDAKLELGRSKEIRKLRRNEDAKSQHLFADESTLGSFVRRLSWTTDGAFLVTPAALWSESSYATLLFARHSYDEPYRVLHGLDKPSVAVRPNPVLFQLPASAKENQLPGLPYRSVFCVLTWDSVLIYDTFHAHPLSIIRGLHYANLNDATWGSDGHTLLVCSTDGYLSVIQFAPGELGQVYHRPQPAAEQRPAPALVVAKKSLSSHTSHPSPAPPLPPCEPGPVVVENTRPAKKAKRVTPTHISSSTSSSTAKRPADEATVVGDAVDKLTLANTLQPKKKKRIQPTLLAKP